MTNKRLEVRSPEKVFEEIRYLHYKRNINYFVMTGSGFYSFAKDPKTGRQWYEVFCDLVSRDGMQIQWSTETRIDASDRKFFKAIKDIGCIQVGFGIESGSEAVLHRNNKNLTKKIIKQRVKEAKEAGIEMVRGNFILGLPFETKKTVMETIQLISELPLDGIGIGILDPYPGTDVYEMIKTGEGGMRLASDTKLTWDSYTRLAAQVIVNDLTVENLASYLDMAKIVHEARKALGEMESVDLLISCYASHLKEQSKQRINELLKQKKILQGRISGIKKRSEIRINDLLQQKKILLKRISNLQENQS
jgi:radical SAM superfamily enzyme YgiQ (UPF0313 family)